MHAVVFFIASWCACALADSAQYYEPDEADRYFEEFIIKFSRQYSDEHEKATRFEIFKLNLEHVNELNKDNQHGVFGITQFMDLTKEEFSQKHGGLLHRLEDDDFCPNVIEDKDIPDVNAPESFDWRQQGAVTGIKSQQCGNCYAYSATGNIEGQHFIKHKKLLNLSEQQITDCDTKSFGCSGGLMSTSFRALASLGGSMTESDYPEESGQGQCRSDKSKIAIKVTNCTTYNLKSQEKLKQLLFSNGPISIAVRSDALVTYTNGVLLDERCLSGNIDHAVLLVGYGISEKNVPFWIVKNSWGIDQFGEAGYFRMERSENLNGACGMMNSNMASAIIE